MSITQQYVLSSGYEMEHCYWWPFIACLMYPQWCWGGVGCTHWFGECMQLFQEYNI